MSPVQSGLHRETPGDELRAAAKAIRDATQAGEEYMAAGRVSRAIHEQTRIWKPPVTELAAAVLERWAWLVERFPDAAARVCAEETLTLARAINSSAPSPSNTQEETAGWGLDASRLTQAMADSLEAHADRDGLTGVERGVFLARGGHAPGQACPTEPPREPKHNYLVIPTTHVAAFAEDARVPALTMQRAAELTSPDIQEATPE